ncbi:hypothetical protein JL12_10950 [Gallibacterium anatis 10672-6]|uniref:hypothetical protein n=1 Tax=Gallibacterium anatis TaxID=750 RepID=UPI000530C388|nr:hypothetical protein [Gallibacterium anatis]KGQ47672.1 hypothetical protein JL12_10950 [Gallibacterium anatis 10672-6]
MKIKIKTLLFASLMLLVNNASAISTGYNGDLTKNDINPIKGELILVMPKSNINKHKFNEECVKNNKCYIEVNNKKYFYKDLKNPSATKKELLSFANINIDRYKYDMLTYLNYFDQNLITKKEVEEQYYEYVKNVNKLYEMMLKHKYYKIYVLNRLNLMSMPLNSFKKILLEKKEEIENEKEKMEINFYYMSQFLYYVNKLEQFDESIIFVKDFN